AVALLSRIGIVVAQRRDRAAPLVSVVGDPDRLARPRRSCRSTILGSALAYFGDPNVRPLSGTRSGASDRGDRSYARASVPSSCPCVVPHGLLRGAVLDVCHRMASDQERPPIAAGAERLRTLDRRLDRRF